MFGYYRRHDIDVVDKNDHDDIKIKKTFQHYY